MPSVVSRPRPWTIWISIVTLAAMFASCAGIGAHRIHQIYYLGTFDPTAWLCVPTALEFVGSLFAGGWAELRARNRELVLEGRRSLCEALDIGAPAPESMIGSLAAVPLPDGDPGEFNTPLHLDPIHVALFEEHRIEVPVMAWPAPPRRVLRISAQAYNRREQYERLATALRGLV